MATEASKARVDLGILAPDVRIHFSLMRELDRLGVYREYEDRFLDLFKRAE